MGRENISLRGGTVPPPPLKMSKGKLHSNLCHANQEVCILFPEQKAVFLSE